MSASKEAKEMISNQADLKEIMSENEKLLLENKEMKVRIPVIESERDDYMRRMVELEEALALSELRGLNLQRLKARFWFLLAFFASHLPLPPPLPS